MSSEPHINPSPIRYAVTRTEILSQLQRHCYSGMQGLPSKGTCNPYQQSTPLFPPWEAMTRSFYFSKVSCSKPLTGALSQVQSKATLPPSDSSTPLVSGAMTFQPNFGSLAPPPKEFEPAHPPVCGLSQPFGKPLRVFVPPRRTGGSWPRPFWPSALPLEYRKPPPLGTPISTSTQLAPGHPQPDCLRPSNFRGANNNLENPKPLNASCLGSPRLGVHALSIARMKAKPPQNTYLPPGQSSVPERTCPPRLGTAGAGVVLQPLLPLGLPQVPSCPMHDGPTPERPSCTSPRPQGPSRLRRGRSRNQMEQLPSLPHQTGSFPHRSWDQKPPHRFPSVPNEMWTARQFAYNFSSILLRKCPMPIPRARLYFLIRMLLRRFLLRFPHHQQLLFRNFLWRLLFLNFFLLWLQKYYPELFQQLPVIPQIAQRGLGPRGNFQIPRHIWDRIVNPNLMRILRAVTPLFPGRNRSVSGTTLIMLQKLKADGFFQDCPRGHNATLFVIPKTSEKCSLIADLRFLNQFSPKPLPKFRLPTIEHIASVIRDHPPGSLWATSLDLKNFYWSLLLPEEFRDVFRTPLGSFTSLPFGWNLSCALAQETLTELVMQVLLDDALLPFLGHKFHLWIYLDDILILSSHKDCAESVINSIASALESKGFIISPKSIRQGTQTITWIGKTYYLDSGFILNTERSLARLFGQAILSCILPLNVRRLDALLGTLNWAFRPLPGLALFTAPWYALRWGHPKVHGFPPPSIQHLLLDACLLALHGWKRPAIVSKPWLCPLIASDAAMTNDQYQAGLLSPLFGGRTIILHPWISSQQQAEIAGMLEGVKIALHTGLHAITLIGDNLASLFALRKMRPFHGNRSLTRWMRSIFNFMWETRLGIHLVWVPSAIQPADPLSRLSSSNLECVEQAMFDANLRWRNMWQNLGLSKNVGYVHL